MRFAYRSPHSTTFSTSSATFDCCISTSVLKSLSRFAASETSFRMNSFFTKSFASFPATSFTICPMSFFWSSSSRIVKPGL